jgi:hypothetical protein
MFAMRRGQMLMTDEVHWPAKRVIEVLNQGTPG